MQNSKTSAGTKLGNEQMLMFEDSAKLLPSPLLTSGLTCNSCEHRQRWECNSKVFQYCGVRKSNMTDNGLLKIKCKTDACPLHVPCR
jgi:hypothetical protein